MKNLIRFIVPITFRAAGAHAHVTAYPHGHPHTAGTTWADVLITSGIIGVLALGAIALLRLRDRKQPVRQKIR